MTDREIYKLWRSKTSDLRYFRPKRWDELKKVIIEQGVKSVLEFGSGVSTFLFDNINLKVVSFETDPKYMEFVKSLCSPKVTFKLWDNKSATINDFYDLALVDGVLPRTHQLEIALKHAKFIAIDDFKDSLLRKLTNYERIDSRSTILAVFVRLNTELKLNLNKHQISGTDWRARIAQAQVNR